MIGLNNKDFNMALNIVLEYLLSWTKLHGFRILIEDLERVKSLLAGMFPVKLVQPVLTDNEV